MSLDPTVGAEMRKTRPVIVVSDDAIGRLPLKVVVPVTDWSDRYAHAPWMIRLNASASSGLTKPSAADCFQLRSVSDARFLKRIGRLDAATMDGVRTAMAIVLSIR